MAVEVLPVALFVVLDFVRQEVFDTIPIEQLVTVTEVQPVEEVHPGEGFLILPPDEVIPEASFPPMAPWVDDLAERFCATGEIVVRVGDRDAPRGSLIIIQHSPEGVLLILLAYLPGPPSFVMVPQRNGGVDVGMFPKDVRGDDSIEFSERDHLPSHEEIVRDRLPIVARHERGRAVAVTGLEAEKHSRPPDRHVHEVVMIRRIRLEEAQARICN
mmetsp:Transcript_34241/g.82796  ORF Transcript_34241/g.82796 Transcript_34241/m.82796 type:complete len:215 (-) Transcript_34241:566-1210(-)